MVTKKGACKKFEGLAIVSILVIIGFLFFVYAYPNFEIGVSVGAGGAGYGGTFNATEDVGYFFNFTINNTNGLIIDAGSFNITEVNITLPGSFVLNASYNNTNANGVANTFHNYTVGTTTVLNWRNATVGPLGFLVNGSNASAWFVFNASQATPGEYEINLTILHGSPATIGDWNITTFVFNMTVNDTTAPVIATPISPINNFNYSGTFVLNFSITDNYKTGSGSDIIDYVNVTVYNVSGDYNASYKASNMSNNYWNVTIDTTQFPDGVYNISIIVNDTVRSVAQSNFEGTNVTVLGFDNSAPVISFSCTPATVNTGSVVTCSCSGTDSPAGVNSTTFTASPVTSNTGSFTQTCTVRDTVGNQGTGSATYIVEMSAGGGSSGGSGTTSAFTYSKTIPKTSQEFSEIKIIETSSFSGGGLGAKERVKIKINNEEHHVGVRSISETKATIEIASDPVQIELAIGEDAKVDVDADNYYDIYVKLNRILNSKADMTIEYLNEAIPEGGSAVSTTGEDVTSETGGIDEGEGEDQGLGANLTWLWVVLGIIVVGIVAWFVLNKKE